MALIPIGVSGQLVNGLELLHRGKVRDTYLLPGFPMFLLVVVSDRISIYDFVLNTTIQDKGTILNAINILWRTRVFLTDFKHDLVAYGNGIDEYLPRELRNNQELQSRATVVHRLDMLDFEGVVRGYLTGSGFKKYEQTFPNHILCGHSLPMGLRDGSHLAEPIFTPTTKARVGHDEEISRERVRLHHGSEPERLSLDLYSRGFRFALSRGYILPDAKFEFGRRQKQIVFGDEVFTPDSSRYWFRWDWERAQVSGRSPEPKDKQFARNWGKGVGIDERNPATPKDVEWVHAHVVPNEIRNKITEIYHETLERLFGQSLSEIKRGAFKIAV